jgi:hypothetical protein
VCPIFSGNQNPNRDTRFPPVLGTFEFQSDCIWTIKLQLRRLRRRFPKENQEATQASQLQNAKCNRPDSNFSWRNSEAQTHQARAGGPCHDETIGKIRLSDAHPEKRARRSGARPPAVSMEIPTRQPAAPFHRNCLPSYVNGEKQGRGLFPSTKPFHPPIA